MPTRTGVSVERRMPITSYPTPRRRSMTRPACAAPAECCAAEPVWRRWYVPLVAAALAIVGLIIAAVVALEMVSRVPERSAPPATPQVEELLVSEP